LFTLVYIVSIEAVHDAHLGDVLALTFPPCLEFLIAVCLCTWPMIHLVNRTTMPSTLNSNLFQMESNKNRCQ